MKIAILSDDFPPKSFGGAGIVVFEQARELARRGHEIVVITTTQEKDEVGRTDQEGIKIYRLYANYHERFLAYRSIYNTQTIPFVRDILREFRPDVVHTHNVHQYLSYYTLALARRYAAKVFLTAHDAMAIQYGKLFPRLIMNERDASHWDYQISAWKQLRAYRLRFNPLRNVLIRHYLKNTDTIFAVSSALAEALRQNGIGGVEVLYNGIDVERFVATAEDIDAFKKKQHLCGKRVMLFAGRLSRAKGGDVAFALFKKVHEALPEICLLVVGKEDAYARRLVRQAQDAELEDHVILTGWLSQEEMVLAYAASDLVLFLSLYLDAFGMVNLEAMAAHKPVIGTCFGGTPEVIVDGETGYIVDPHNLARVAERTLAILTNSARAQRFGRAGYERARSAFSLTRQVDALERYYRAMA